MAKTYVASTALADTGILYALADRTDRWHKRSVDFIKRFKGKLIVAATVIPEVCYLLNAHLGPNAEHVFLESLTNRELAYEAVGLDDISRCIEIMRNYKDMHIGFVDASLVAVSERLKISSLLTTDRRHFTAIRPKHCPNFELLP